MRKTIYSTLLVGLLAASSVAAANPDATPQVSMRVPYGDLNLGREAGAATLNRRVHQAARQICGLIRNQSAVELAQRRACRREALASATPQVSAAIALARSTGDRLSVVSR